MIKRAYIFKLFKFGSLLAILCLLYGFFVEPKTLAVRHVEIVSKTWQGPPLKIGLMGDIHVGGWHVDAERIEGLVQRLNALSPDIILLAGDYVNGHKRYEQSTARFNAELETGMRNLGQLEAPLGVHAVIGNHDAWYSDEHIRSYLTAANITIHNNQSMKIDKDETSFCLVGLADAITGFRDDSVFSNCGAGADIIAFMHSPDSFDLLRSDTNLALAAHTHGGQINIPFIGRRVTATKSGLKYAYGRIDLGGIPAFVTAGIGTSILPARFRAPPEIVLITLRSP